MSAVIGITPNDKRECCLFTTVKNAMLQSAMSFEMSLGEYHDEVLGLQNQLVTAIDMSYGSEADPASQVPGYITHGAEYSVFRLKDSSKIAKLAMYGWAYEENHDQNNEQFHERNIIALERCIGVPQLEQMVAAATAYPPAIVTEFIPGTIIREDIKKGRRFVPDDFHTLFIGFEALYSRDLVDDAAGDNVLFLKSFGFTLLDFCTPDASFEPSIEKSILGFVAEEQILASIKSDARQTRENVSAYITACRKRYGSAMAEHVSNKLEYEYPGLLIGSD